MPLLPRPGSRVLRLFFLLCGLLGVLIACSQREFNGNGSDSHDGGGDTSDGSDAGDDSDVPDGDAIWDTSRWDEARFGK